MFIVVTKGRDLQRHGVRQRPPEVFAVSVENREAFAVMHGRAKIIEPVAVGLVIEEHRSQRCQPRMRQVHARKQRGGS